LKQRKAETVYRNLKTQKSKVKIQQQDLTQMVFENANASVQKQNEMGPASPTSTLTRGMSPRSNIRRSRGSWNEESGVDLEGRSKGLLAHMSNYMHSIKVPKKQKSKMINLMKDELTSKGRSPANSIIGISPLSYRTVNVSTNRTKSPFAVSNRVDLKALPTSSPAVRYAAKR